MIAIGKFLKTFGVKGYLKFLSYSGETQHLVAVSSFSTQHNQNHALQKKITFKNTPTVHVAQEHYTVENWDVSSSMFISCKIKDFNTPEDARFFTGKDMYVQEHEASPLKKNEYYIHELIGCEVYFQGECIGKVKNIYSDAYAPLLEIIQKTASQTTTSKREKPPKRHSATVPFLSRFFAEPYKKEDRYCIDVLDNSVLYWV